MNLVVIYIIFCIVILLIICGTIVIGVVSKKENEKAKKRYGDNYIIHLNNVMQIHQNLCSTAQYYIQNDYIVDITPKLNVYNRNISKNLYQLERFFGLFLSLKKRSEWDGILDQAYIYLERCREEQNRFSQELAYCEQEEQRYKKAFTKYAPKPDLDKENTVSGLFRGCNDYESLHKRYKELMRIYHSDNQNGDDTMAGMINAEYERLKKQYCM